MVLPGCCLCYVGNSFIEIKKAEHAFRPALEVYTQDALPATWANLGLVLAQQVIRFEEKTESPMAAGSLDEAMSIYNELERVTSNFTYWPGEALHRAASDWMVKDHLHGRTLEYAEYSVKLKPENPEYLGVLAEIHLDLGNIEAALMANNEARGHAGDNMELLFSIDERAVRICSPPQLNGFLT